MLAGLLAAGVPAFQAHSYHRQGIKQATQLHMDAMVVAKEQHLTQMKHDTEIARRESLRDLWGQKNHKTQTLMITDTLMFGCGFTLIVEGSPPDGASGLGIGLYSFAAGASLCFLFTSLWFAMNVQSRMTNYSISNSQQIYQCGHGVVSRHQTFGSYYECHCKHIAGYSIKLFYLGTGMLLVAVAILAYMRFTITYGDLTAAILFVVITAITLFLFFVLRYVFPTKTRLTAEETRALLEEHDAADIESPPPVAMGELESDGSDTFDVSRRLGAHNNPSPVSPERHGFSDVGAYMRSMGGRPVRELDPLQRGGSSASLRKRRWGSSRSSSVSGRGHTHGSKILRLCSRGSSPQAVGLGLVRSPPSAPRPSGPQAGPAEGPVRQRLSPSGSSGRRARELDAPHAEPERGSESPPASTPDVASPEAPTPSASEPPPPRAGPPPPLQNHRSHVATRLSIELFEQVELDAKRSREVSPPNESIL